MKRILVFLSMLVCLNATAQYKPLKDIVIPDDPIYQMDFDSRNNVTETINYYTVSAHLTTIAVSHAKGIAYPELNYNVWELRIRLNEENKDKFLLLTQSKEIFNGYWEGDSSHRLLLSIGEEEYHINTWSLSGNHLFIEVHKDVIKHISVSGLQCIYAHTTDKILFEYSDITQEFWRRCAHNVYEGRKHL